VSERRGGASATAVAITGVGLHTAFGDTAATMTALCEGRSGVRSYELEGAPGFGLFAAAPAPTPRPAEFLTDKKLVKYMSPATAMAVTAAGRALDDAGLRADAVHRAPMGLYVAAGLIAFDVAAVRDTLLAAKSDDGTLNLPRLGREGFKLCHPLMPFKLLTNMPLGLTSIGLELRGTNFITYPDAGQAGVCLETAARNIANGRLAGALAGGTAEWLSLMPLTTLARRDRLAKTPDAARTFVRGHAGWAPANGASFVALETAAQAKARGAPIQATLERVHAGYCPDAGDRDARRHARRHAWQMALGAAAPDLVLSSGNLDDDDDAAEQSDARRAFGERCCVTSLDGLLGFADAAAPLAAVGVAARLLCDRATLPEHAKAATKSPRTILVSVAHPDGGTLAALLRRGAEST